MGNAPMNYGSEYRQKSSPSKIIADSMRLTDEYRKAWNGAPYKEDDEDVKPTVNNVAVNSSTDAITGRADAQVSIVNQNVKSGNQPYFNIEAGGKKLQEAVIWSEILGKPLSKRRKRRYYAE